MKKVILSLITLIVLITVSGCFKRDTMEGIKIYTTLYPIEYITNTLYGDHATVVSIYPDNIDVSKYKFTDKQLSDYSTGDLYIYNGLSPEKNYAIEMLNKNRRLKIIDAAMNMEYVYGIEELWLDPSNFLMLSQNIKKGFEEYIANPYLKNEINKNYESLKIKLSAIDAELKLIAENANNKTIVVANDSFLFLEKYEINVISLQEGSITDKKVADVQRLKKDGSINYIFAKSTDDLNDVIKDLINKSNMEVLIFNTASNLTEQQRYDRLDFIDIMNSNINLLKQELYK
jgi:zinc transport system substrate-binding protein